MSDDYQFDSTDILARIIAPFGSAMLALTQFPATRAGEWMLVGIIVVGLFIAVNQTLEALDRQLNTTLYERDV